MKNQQLLKVTLPLLFAFMHGAKMLFKNVYNMRTFLVTICLLLSMVGDAQHYKFEYDVYFDFGKTGGDHRFYCSMWYTTLYNEGHREVRDFHTERETNSKHVKGSFNIPANEGPITRIWINTEHQHNTIGAAWQSNCHMSTKDGTSTLIYQNPGSTDSTVAHKFTKKNVGRWGWGCLEFASIVILGFPPIVISSIPVGVGVNEFKLIPEPDLTITSSSNDGMIPIDDKIKLQATAGFMLKLYKWEYALETDPFQPMPASYRNTPSFDISAADLLGKSKAEMNNAKPLRFRINYGGGYYSDTFPLSIRYSSPHITWVGPIQPKCYGDRDGSAKIYFDRPLKTGEGLSITLKNVTDGVDVKGVDTITSFDAGNTVTLPHNLKPAKYEIGLIGYYPDASKRTYTGDKMKHFYTFTITDPEKLSYTATKQNDVRCHGNSDGAIKLTATGGNKSSPYLFCYKKNWQTNFTLPKSFSGFTTHTLTDLDTGIYIIRVTDANGCFQKDGMNKEVVSTVTITQPAEPVRIESSEVKDPLGYGRTDGRITVRVKGGTKKSDSSYNIIWQKEDGTILTSVANKDLGASYESVLQNIGKGNYLVIITDDNFSAATTASGTTKGCMVIDSFTVNEPPPIIINIVQQKNILCKGQAAGELVAHVTGGVPYKTGTTIPYEYQWFKREATDIDLGKTDSIVSGLKAGDYVVKITDSNRIEKISNVFTITEPDSLKIHFTTTVNACTATGNIRATITGGTAPYSIDWTTGSTTDTINNRKADIYLATATDVNGCETQAPIKLVIPNAITINNTIQNPSYYSSKDGSIQLNVSNGTPPYTYRWSNGATTKDIQNLAAGPYSILVTDDSGCVQTQTFTLQNPPRIIHIDGTPLNGNNTKTLCNGQYLNIDATIADNAATYQWSSNNGFNANTAKVTLTTAGAYWIKITDGRGVTANDTLIIKRSNADINASFVVSTQAFKGEKVTFVNISYPAPQRIQWEIPNSSKIEVTQNNQNVAELIFKDTGTYIISMKAIVGECEQTITKKVIVVEGQQFDDIGITKNPFIKAFSIMPNPNTGQFNVKIELQEPAKIKLRVLNLSNSAPINDKELSGSSQYVIPYTIKAASGTYILLLETPKGNQMQKIIIN